MSVSIRPVKAEDRSAWDVLYQGYADFYKVDQTPQMRDTVWGWLMDESHSSNGFVAVDGEGTLIGLTHYRPFVSCLMAVEQGFLDDLFVDSASRGSGAARALIDAVVEMGRQKGWAKVRWITADDNYRGRGLYDKVATRTMWITYDIRL
ncbi:Acetyltransferase [Sulfitobacter noctilucae]|uniref:GNAT family N-acetyltransferase n=1 Tax=Sulfitobacter noctilucae TaxID=1342302 RepID=UPI000469713D|nr:GNAT family N-acetyltransferase [Sulfitobacter noctilucae]KIN61014.1 Acetyltransferase [Sulfitobacter noctilucae]